MQMDKDGQMVAIELLEGFAALADSGRLFLSRDPDWYADLRSGLVKALDELLFWHRPALEQLRGIDWTYAVFRDRLALFEGLARQDQGFVGLQAKLFLALLPFPGQWSWLEKMTVDCGDVPEIHAFLHNEREVIQRKIEKKQYKRFRLRNFCQVLKSPRLPREKGVLRIFSIPYLFFPVPALLQALGEAYFLYVEPAAGVTFRHTWLRLYSRLKDPVLFGLSSHEDRTFVLGQPNTVTTRLAHGDYLDAEIEMPMAGDKRFDLVFNNTFDERQRKRHELMLDLMDDPRLKTFRVLFMGRGTTENVAGFKGEIDQRGLGSRATVLANLPRKQVDAHLVQCRVGVHLSLMENGCRAVYEYLRADLPCVMSTSTAGMDPSIINPLTGMLATDRELPGAIARTVERADQFSPRKWFLENSGCLNATGQLNRQLKILFESRGYEWQTDIVPLTSSGVGRYFDPQDIKRFEADFKGLTAMFASQPNLPIRLD